MTKMKLSAWVSEQLVAHGVRDVFMLTGGGAMHLNHSLGTDPRLKTTFCQHEQALAMAAEAYYRLTNRLAVVNVTSGPGGTNAITGVYGAFVDWVGMLVISGQVKIETTVRHTGLPLRQYGDQELDIEPIVRPITKYVTMVTDPCSIRYHLEKAIYLATTGRPGPCWLDVQAAQIDPDDLLPDFDPPSSTSRGGGRTCPRRRRRSSSGSARRGVRWCSRAAAYAVIPRMTLKT